MENPYQSPSAPIPEYTAHVDAGSLDAAVNGEYDFEIGEIISEAWELVDGIKGVFFVAGLINFVISIAGDTLLRKLLGPTPGMQGLVSLMMLFINAPLGMGLYMMAVRRASGQPVQVSDVFRYFNPYNPNLVFVQLLQIIAIVLGFLALLIPGIYLATGFTFAPVLVAEKGLGPMEALSVSRKSVHHHWWKISGLLSVLLLIALGGLLALGIGLIWAIPTCMIALGILYRKMYGVTPELQL
jgi:hypothetical protein